MVVQRRDGPRWLRELDDDDKVDKQLGGWQVRQCDPLLTRVVRERVGDSQSR